MEAPSVALCAFKMCQVLACRYVHIQNMAGAALFYHEAHRATKTGGDVNRADLNTHSVFKIKMIILNDF
jgi:hypothetical protein